MKFLRAILTGPLYLQLIMSSLAVAILALILWDLLGWRFAVGATVGIIGTMLFYVGLVEMRLSNGDFVERETNGVAE